ncbi:MAG: DUF1573 domain-containing protein [Flavobacteriaceae bacterium]|nr:DUF1573 domain-containing protein [Flavobacteriaceae bacterium]MBT3920870.1 DUF1573 domain-containing protein [Flavobacteriaceae bacterium]MBT6705333.1 DUF1573 domain-containing protein [Flavobacteriaceae bacterium]MBT7242153.1 DUF1573 domain-containing protein [Flavobacteriaceae bacterium]
MKKIAIIVLIAFVGLIQQVNAQAKIEFKTDIIDYGEIAKGSDGLRIFEFTNTGNAPLIVSNVKSSCGCTVPSKPDGPVAPGESSTIEVKYDTKRIGPIRKTVTVYSNADQPIVSLKIKGKVLSTDVDNGKSVLEKTK